MPTSQDSSTSHSSTSPRLKTANKFSSREATRLSTNTNTISFIQKTKNNAEFFLKEPTEKDEDSEWLAIIEVFATEVLRLLDRDIFAKARLFEAKDKSKVVISRIIEGFVPMDAIGVKEVKKSLKDDETKREMAALSVGRLMFIQDYDAHGRNVGYAKVKSNGSERWALRSIDHGGGLCPVQNAGIELQPTQEMPLEAYTDGSIGYICPPAEQFDGVSRTDIANLPMRPIDVQPYHWLGLSNITDALSEISKDDIFKKWKFFYLTYIAILPRNVFENCLADHSNESIKGELVEFIVKQQQNIKEALKNMPEFLELMETSEYKEWISKHLPARLEKHNQEFKNKQGEIKEWRQRRYIEPEGMLENLHAFIAECAQSKLDLTPERLQQLERKELEKRLVRTNLFIFRCAEIEHDLASHTANQPKHASRRTKLQIIQQQLFAQRTELTYSLEAPVELAAGDLRIELKDYGSLQKDIGRYYEYLLHSSSSTLAVAEENKANNLLNIYSQIFKNENRKTVKGKAMVDINKTQLEKLRDAVNKKRENYNRSGARLFRFLKSSPKRTSLVSRLDGILQQNGERSLDPLCAASAEPRLSR